MANSGTIRVKLSPEDAGAITLSPVVAQDLPLAELIEVIVRVTGKDADRVRRILQLGTLLSGATRYRWAGWDPRLEEVETWLAGFPDADPGRRFVPELCVTAVLQETSGRRIEIPCQVGARRRFLRKSAFWDSLLALARTETMRYIEYSYKEKADCYRVELSAEAALAIQSAAKTIAYRTLADRLRRASLATVDFFVTRRG
jgi:hypothetical protein